MRHLEILVTLSYLQTAGKPPIPPLEIGQDGVLLLINHEPKIAAGFLDL